MANTDELFPVYCIQCKSPIPKAQSDQAQGLCPDCRSKLPPPIVVGIPPKPGPSALAITLFISFAALACTAAFLLLKEPKSPPPQPESNASRRVPSPRKEAFTPRQKTAQELLDEQVERDRRAAERAAAKEAADRARAEMFSDFEFTAGRFNSHIRGRFKNTTGQTIKYLQVSFALFDSQGNRVGTAWDNITNLRPDETWQYDCLVFEDSATTCRFDGVTGF